MGHDKKCDWHTETLIFGRVDLVFKSFNYFSQYTDAFEEFLAKFHLPTSILIWERPGPQIGSVIKMINTMKIHDFPSGV